MKKPKTATAATRQAKSRADREAAGSKRYSLVLSPTSVGHIDRIRTLLEQRGIKPTDKGAIEYALRAAPARYKP